MLILFFPFFCHVVLLKLVDVINQLLISKFSAKHY